MKYFNILFLMIIISFLLLSCDEDKVIEPGGMTITLTNNSTNNIVIQGGDVTFIVSAINISNKTIKYVWEASGGTITEISSSKDTIVWTAPEELAEYQIAVTAFDGEFSIENSQEIEVSEYVPTSSPAYVGSDKCAICHAGGSGGDQHTTWLETHHADAWETLQSSGGAASFCEGCHTVGIKGYGVNTSAMDAGWDEVRIDKFVNVQCENCHGPGSEHAESGDPSKITVNYEAATCGSCHTGTHHPTFDQEWELSPHNFDPETSAFGAPGNSFCQGCHEGVAASIRLSGDLTSFYGGGSISERPTVEEQLLMPITCAVCHNPHDASNSSQMRAVADVHLVTSNGESPVVTDGGTVKLCMQCHHARRGPDTQIENGYAHFGPHANPQADMLSGKSAFQGVADSSFVWADPSHLFVENSCRTCHVHEISAGTLLVSGSISGKVTGHTFEPNVEACGRCHGAISDFDDIMALEDFDGDGAVEGVQSEVQGLMDLLETALVANGLDTTGTDLLGALGDTSTSTIVLREAGYNWAYIHDDKSKGVHNPDYAVQLLQQSIKHLTGSFPANSVSLSYGMKAVGAF